MEEILACRSACCGNFHKSFVVNLQNFNLYSPCCYFQKDPSNSQKNSINFARLMSESRACMCYICDCDIA